MAGQADALGIHLFALRDEGQGVARVGDLIMAAHFAPRAFAFTAAAEVDPEHAVAHFLDHAGDKLDMRFVLGADETVQHDDRGQALTGLAALGHMKNARQFQTVRHEAEFVFHSESLDPQ